MYRLYLTCINGLERAMIREEVWSNGIETEFNAGQVSKATQLPVCSSFGISIDASGAPRQSNAIHVPTDSNSTENKIYKTKSIHRQWNHVSLKLQNGWYSKYYDWFSKLLTWKSDGLKRRVFDHPDRTRNGFERWKKHFGHLKSASAHLNHIASRFHFWKINGL